MNDDDEKDKDRVAHAKLIRLFDDQWPHTLATINIQARVIRARYEALMKKGFNDEQAIHLCHQKWEVL